MQDFFQIFSATSLRRILRKLRNRRHRPESPKEELIMFLQEYRSFQYCPLFNEKELDRALAFYGVELEAQKQEKCEYLIMKIDMMEGYIIVNPPPPDFSPDDSPSHDE